MHTTDRAGRLKYARERAGFESPRLAARHFRWNENTYKAREGGLRDYGIEEAIEYARAFRVSWVWLASGEGGHSNTKNMVIGGIVTAGGAIDRNVSDYIPDDMIAVELDWAMPDDAEAFQVAGNGMMPKYDPGDVIIVRSTNVHPDILIGEYALVTCGNSERYLRRIQKGDGSDRYDLEAFNAPTIKSSKISHVSFVLLTVPGRRLKHHPAKPKSLKKISNGFSHQNNK